MKGADPHPAVLTLSPGPRSYRHCPATVQSLDGSLSFPLTPEFHKGTAWCGKQEWNNSGHRSQRVRKVAGKTQGQFRSPLLVPSGLRRTVHSSIWPKGWNRRLTSSSPCCLPNIPTNSFRSSGDKTRNDLGTPRVPRLPRVACGSWEGGSPVLL